MNKQKFCRFPLRHDFHQEVGWQAFVRERASLDPTVVSAIIGNRGLFCFGRDPLTLIERWEPYTMGWMFYFWMVRKGGRAPTFVASDGIFTMSVEPLAGNQHLAGLPDDLLALANEAVAQTGASIDPSPVMPFKVVETRPATTNAFPDQMVVHRYHEGVAYLRPCMSTLTAIDADPVLWASLEPKYELPRST